jgi:ABC-2 type transport system permease protein
MIAVARTEFIHVLRDWRSLFLAIAIPMVLILLFGYALTLDLKKVPTVIWDRSRTPESRELLSLFAGSPYFSIRAFSDGYGALQRDINAGKAMIALVIPGDFADRLHAGRPVTIQVIVDGSDANTSRLAASYTRSLGMIYNRNIRAASLRSAEGGVVDLAPRVWYNADMRSKNMILPGIVAIVMMVIAAMLTSVTVAREWETGTMEQLISTPIRAPELIFGKVIPYFVIGMVDVAVAVAMGQWLFQVPLRGSPALLFSMAALFLTGALFLGMTLSITLKSQVLANQIAIVAGFLPTLILSGFVFAIENMPLLLQFLTYLVPARYFIAIMRGIYMKGIGMEILWIDALLLFVYAAIMVLAANRRLKLRME